MIVKREHIAVGPLHDVDIAHKSLRHDVRLNKLNRLCVRPHIVLELTMVIRAVIHGSRDARIRYSTPARDCERSAISKRKEPIILLELVV